MFQTGDIIKLATNLGLEHCACSASTKKHYHIKSGHSDTKQIGIFVGSTIDLYGRMVLHFFIQNKFCLRFNPGGISRA